MNIVVNLIDFSWASTTLQKVGESATPIFASTIEPAAFLAGIPIGGWIVFAVISALLGAVSAVVMGFWRGSPTRSTEMRSRPSTNGYSIDLRPPVRNYMNE